MRIERLSNHEGGIQNKTIISFKFGGHHTFMRNAATEIAIPSELRWVTFSGRNMKDYREHNVDVRYTNNTNTPTPTPMTLTISLTCNARKLDAWSV